MVVGILPRTGGPVPISRLEGTCFEARRLVKYDFDNAASRALRIAVGRFWRALGPVLTTSD
jgi:hypothetical protein